MHNNPYVKELRKNHVEFLFRGMLQLVLIDIGVVNIKSDNELVETDMFVATSYDRSWALEAGYAEKSKFSNREEFDETVMPKEDRTGTFDTSYGKSSFSYILEHLKLNLSINFDHVKFKNFNKCKENEDILLNQELINLYGESQDDEIDLITNLKTFVVIDFRILSNCGNFFIATAERANFYLVFLLQLLVQHKSFLLNSFY